MTRRSSRFYVPIGIVVVVAAILAIIVFPKVGFGQQDRTTLATKAVATYWNELGHGKVRAAYNMLSSGNRAARPFATYSQDMFSFLEQTGGVTARPKAPQVNGDTAVVPVSLYFVRANRPLNAYQHLFWESGGWHVTDMNGGVSQHK